MEPRTQVRIAGVVTSSKQRLRTGPQGKQVGRLLKILFPKSGQTLDAVCYLDLPIKAGDLIAGKADLDSNDIMHITHQPLLTASNERTHIIKSFTYALGFAFGRASKFYGHIYALHPDEEEVVRFLDQQAHLAHKTAPSKPLSDLTTEETKRLLAWWYKERCVRALRLLGLKHSEIDNPYQTCQEIVELYHRNPYAILTLPLDRCDYLLELQGKPIDQTLRLAGEIVRFILKRTVDGSACVPEHLVHRHYPAAVTHRQLLQDEYNVVQDLGCYYLASVQKIESGLATRLIEFVSQSPIPEGEYRLPDSLSPDQHSAVVGALNQRLSIVTGTAGTGKCLGWGTKILLFDGSIREVQDIVPGDELMGPNSSPRTVLSLARGEDDLYEICPRYGEKFVCNRAHILTLASPPPSQTGVAVYYFRRGLMFSRHCLTEEAAQEFCAGLSEDIFDLSVEDYLKVYDKMNIYQLYYQGVNFEGRTDSYRAQLHDLIPDLFSGRRCEIVIDDAIRAQEVVFMARSLGCQVTVESSQSSHKCTITYHQSGRYFVPFTVHPIGRGQYYGFELSGDGRFLLHDFLVTHNTTCLAEIVRQLEIARINYLVCSFTGKAVARIREVTKLRAPMTMHRAIANSTKKEDREEYTYLIIDEASMVTVELFYKLLECYPSIEQITLVGDDNQLCPIGWGSLLDELIRSSTVPLFRLTVNHRVYQNAGGTDGITHNAHRLILHRTNDPFRFTETSNFAILEGEIALVYDIVRGCYDAGLKAHQLIVLSPYNEYIKELNRNVQAIYNRSTEEVNDSAGIKWKRYDKVMMTENDYEIGVYNGEMGMVTELPQVSELQDGEGGVTRSITDTRSGRRSATDTQNGKTKTKALTSSTSSDSDLTQTSLVKWNGAKDALDSTFETYHTDLTKFASDKKGITVDFGPMGSHVFSLQRADKKSEFYVENNHEQNNTVAVLTHGYAISIDKSQGSEWDFVIIYLRSNSDSPFLNRNRIFTALTRAKRAVWVVTNDRESLSRAAVRAPPRRYENLSRRLSKSLPKIAQVVNCDMSEEELQARAYFDDSQEYDF